MNKQPYLSPTESRHQQRTPLYSCGTMMAILMKFINHLSIDLHIAEAIRCYKFLAVFLLNSPVFLSKHMCLHFHGSYRGCLNYALRWGNNDNACKDGTSLQTPIKIQ